MITGITTSLSQVQGTRKNSSRIVSLQQISDDSITSPAIPTYMDKYTISKIRFNNRVCKAYIETFIRYQATLKPARHAVAWIESSSSLMKLIS